MEAPDVLAIHAVAHPNPTVRRVGFAFDDPYVQQVWAGVIGPSALLVLRRVPVLWRERERALVHLRELGQSLGLGPVGRAERASGSHRSPDVVVADVSWAADEGVNGQRLWAPCSHVWGDDEVNAPGNGPRATRRRGTMNE
jgi:hypothetical protein